MSKIVHPVSGEVNKISVDELLSKFLGLTHFSESDSELINGSLEKVDLAVEVSCAKGVILFENLDLSSSRLGQMSIRVYGPCCGIRTIKEVENPACHVGDLPSQRQYPVAYAVLDTPGQLPWILSKGKLVAKKGKNDEHDEQPV